MFTILARLQNIPTRIVTGYLGGEYNDIGNFYTFRQSDAHSWVEVYINDKGWIKFDPTLAIPKENILSFNNYSLKDFQSNSIDDEATSKLSMIKLYYSYFDYTWTNKFLNYNKESRDKFLKNKIKNFEIKKEFYIFIVVFFLMLLFYKITKSLMQKKLFFTLFFNKIKSQKGINSNVLTHQEIKVILSVREKIKLNEIFTIYEKIIFAKKCNLTIKNYFYFNYKIIRFCYFNK